MGRCPDDEWELAEPPQLEVEDTPNPVVGTLLGPGGDVIARLYERPRLPLGYHGGRREPSRIERT